MNQLLKAVDTVYPQKLMESLRKSPFRMCNIWHEEGDVKVSPALCVAKGG